MKTPIISRIYKQHQSLCVVAKTTLATFAKRHSCMPHDMTKALAF